MRWSRHIFAIAIAAIVIVGWQLLRFDCDDAYINYRYVSNSMLGLGFVWNPEPFAPVEGYTSLLWLVLLRVVWTVSGVEPPQAAHVLTLLFGFGTLLVGWRLMRRLQLAPTIIAMVILATATSRVFLTWLSSGLETSMFVFLLTSWIFFAIQRPGARGLCWALALSSTATLVALARPDGMLCVAASIAVLACWMKDAQSRRLSLGFGALPLLGIVAHLLWRHSFYGSWLPNTYWAKHSAWWPESGLRYAASFCVENGAWFWLLLTLTWGSVALLRGQARWQQVREHPGAIMVICVLILHFGFYTFAIGGDIFEYRVYAQLILLLFLSGAWMAQHLFRRQFLAALTLLALVVATHSVAWLHYADATKLRERLPGIVRPIVDEFHDWQTWLHKHMVCVRHDRHAYFVEHLQKTYPTREQGKRISWKNHPIHVVTAAGIAGWTLPHVALIDVYGLNDAVVARAPVPTPDERLRELVESQRKMFAVLDANQDGKVVYDELRPAFAYLWPTLAGSAQIISKGVRGFLNAHDKDGDAALSSAELFPPSKASASSARRMGHEHLPPPGYVEGFRANVRIVNRKVVVDRRKKPLSDEEIIEHERTFRAKLR